MKQYVLDFGKEKKFMIQQDSEKKITFKYVFETLIIL